MHHLHLMLLLKLITTKLSTSRETIIISTTLIGIPTLHLLWIISNYLQLPPWLKLKVFLEQYNYQPPWLLTDSFEGWVTGLRRVSTCTTISSCRPTTHSCLYDLFYDNQYCVDGALAGHATHADSISWWYHLGLVVFHSIVIQWLDNLLVSWLYIIAMWE